MVEVKRRMVGSQLPRERGRARKAYPAMLKGCIASCLVEYLPIAKVSSFFTPLLFGSLLVCSTAWSGCAVASFGRACHRRRLPNFIPELPHQHPSTFSHTTSFLDLVSYRSSTKQHLASFR
ncbi:hypothetical protein HDK77DRAFT_162530 [Phyllosticta capitalensis]